MSTLITENLQDSGGSVPVATVRQGSAKAWAALNGAFAVADSFNVSSSVDLGTANSRIIYTNALTGAPSASVAADASTSAPWFTSADSIEPTQCSAVTFTNAGVLQDLRPTYYVVHGDLA